MLLSPALRRAKPPLPVPEGSQTPFFLSSPGTDGPSTAPGNRTPGTPVRPDWGLARREPPAWPALPGARFTPVAQRKRRGGHCPPGTDVKPALTGLLRPHSPHPTPPHPAWSWLVQAAMTAATWWPHQGDSRFTTQGASQETAGETDWAANGSQRDKPPRLGKRAGAFPDTFSINRKGREVTSEERGTSHTQDLWGPQVWGPASPLRPGLRFSSVEPAGTSQCHGDHGSNHRVAGGPSPEAWCSAATPSEPHRSSQNILVPRGGPGWAQPIAHGHRLVWMQHGLAGPGL